MVFFEDKEKIVKVRTLLLTEPEILEYVKQEYLKMVGSVYYVTEVSCSNYPAELRIYFRDEFTGSTPDEDFSPDEQLWKVFINKMKKDFGCYVGVPGYYWSK
jgi:hypothetical protein